MADSIQTLNQLVTNFMTKMLQVLENDGNLDYPVTARDPNFNEFLDSTSELFEAGRVLAFQVFEILEENGIETEAMANEFSRAVNQTQSLDAEAQESLTRNFGQQVLGEILNNPRLMELKEELETYYGRIITHESLREIIEKAYDLFESLSSRQERSDIQRAEVKEELKNILRKFLEVETALNDQYN